jgi:hypothetical protein
MLNEFQRCKDLLLNKFINQQQVKFEFDMHGDEFLQILDLTVLDFGTGLLNNNELSLNDVYLQKDFLFLMLI